MRGRVAAVGTLAWEAVWAPLAWDAVQALLAWDAVQAPLVLMLLQVVRVGGAAPQPAVVGVAWVEGTAPQPAAVGAGGLAVQRVAGWPVLGTGGTHVQSGTSPDRSPC